MNILNDIKLEIQSALKVIFAYECDLENITLEETIKNYDGFYTFIIFSHTSNLKQKPEHIGEKLGEYLKVNSIIISDFNVVKGFLNFDLSDNYLISIFNHIVNFQRVSNLHRDHVSIFFYYASRFVVGFFICTFA